MKQSGITAIVELLPKPLEVQDTQSATGEICGEGCRRSLG